MAKFETDRGFSEAPADGPKGPCDSPVRVRRHDNGLLLLFLKKSLLDTLLAEETTTTGSISEQHTTSGVREKEEACSTPSMGDVTKEGTTQEEERNAKRRKIDNAEESRRKSQVVPCLQFHEKVLNSVAKNKRSGGFRCDENFAFATLRFEQLVQRATAAGGCSSIGKEEPTTTCSSAHKLRCGVRGCVVEVNPRLVRVAEQLNEIFDKIAAAESTATTITTDDKGKSREEEEDEGTPLEQQNAILLPQAQDQASVLVQQLFHMLRTEYMLILQPGNKRDEESFFKWRGNGVE